MHFESLNFHRLSRGMSADLDEPANAAGCHEDSQWQRLDSMQQLDSKAPALACIAPPLDRSSSNSCSAANRLDAPAKLYGVADQQP
jgi:hypothetical protein